jgi:phosphoribosylformylglycinamidine synthase PurS subunit
VKAGKVLELSLPKMGKAQLEKKVKEMCDKLLANPIIEDFEIEVAE